MDNETPGGELLGALEAGGTKMVCATGYADGTVLERTEFPTTAPAETIEQIVGWFQGRGITALGIGAFGPTGVNPKSSQYGYILDTPKVAWRNFNMLGALWDALGVPCGYDTDVNVACLGECSFGCGKGLDNVLYLTVGTGVGAGVMCEGKLVHGMLHPEAGHIRIQKDPDDPIGATSGCPYHDDCLEGLIAGPAIKKRWNGHGPARWPTTPPPWTCCRAILPRRSPRISCACRRKRSSLAEGWPTTRPSSSWPGQKLPS